MLDGAKIDEIVAMYANSMGTKPLPMPSDYDLYRFIYFAHTGNLPKENSETKMGFEIASKVQLMPNFKDSVRKRECPST